MSLYYVSQKSYRAPFGLLRGNKIRFFPDLTFHMMLGLWEPENLRLIERLFRLKIFSRPIVADIGANIGYFTLGFSKLVPHGSVYAFEPSPRMVERLQDNVRLNKLQNVTIVPKACSNMPGQMDFYVGRHFGASSLFLEMAEGSDYKPSAITVEVTSLDYFFIDEARDAPSFIKIDIEGAAALALEGSKRLVQKVRPIFLIESHSHEEDRAISNLILQNDYCGFRVQDNQKVTSPEAIHPDPNGVWGTILAYPQETRVKIENMLGIS